MIDVRRIIEIGDRLAEKQQARTLGVDPHVWDWQTLTAPLREDLGMPEKRFA